MSSLTRTSIFKPLTMADSSSLLSLPSIFTTPSKAPYSYLPLPTRHVKLQLSCSHSSFSLKSKIKLPSIVTFVAQTSDWAQQEEDDKSTTVTIEEGEEEGTWENEETEGEESVVEASGGGGGEEEESGGFGGFEEEVVEPPEEAKLFVGNLPYDVDSQSLAMLFEQAGTVEISEVIYNRETEQSRGFGFVTMSTVEEAEAAVEKLNSYDLNGRLLTVNKAAPRGSRPERPPRVFQPSFRIYVGNLPWDVDNSRLEQVFSEHGKVVEARVVYDRETGRSRGFGFVTMASEEELNDAIAALDGQSLEGRSIRVNAAEERRRSF